MRTKSPWFIVVGVALFAGCGHPQANSGLLREYPPLPKLSTGEKVRRPVVAQSAQEGVSNQVATPSPERSSQPVRSRYESAADRATLTVVGPTRCQVRLAGEPLGRVPIKAHTVHPGRYHVVIRCGQRRTKQVTELKSGQEVTWRIRRRGRWGLRLIRSG